ncbi:uncharacterized protein B0I36DRAFT_330948 [Microdochium trichocladiopsis]|uniref:Proteinase inhibitor I78 n=1 Tax=Microdochium trichocladiopsis TaxID=1682393 RepID=A0A9P8Y161_9PEZI|nr:uncharacterized protein B0I36DRAFT_330948 [Microdochium trichocladiopsis]KAH7026586.1 hypothetical protein B0I36DRAFT_330948 [Microdochium trichocladiopsis]
MKRPPASCPNPSANTILRHPSILSTSPLLKMPLVVPDLASSSSEDRNQEWTTKLVGKTVNDDGHSETNFCKKDLPENCRVLTPGAMATRDFRPDRLNVHVKEDGTVSHVYHG